MPPATVVIIETTTLWDPNIKPDKLALPLALGFVIGIILIFLLAAVISTYRKRQKDKEK